MLRPINRQTDSGKNDEEPEPSARHYDSFVVRIWHEQSSARLLRAEVRHVQTNHADTAIDVDPAWLLTTIMDHLDGAPS